MAVTLLHNIDTSSIHFAEELSRDGATYVAPIHEPLLIATGTVTLGDTTPDSKFITLADLDDVHSSFFKRVEERVLEHCSSHAGDWFSGLSTSNIQGYLKSFVTENSLLVKIAPNDVESFDACTRRLDGLPPPGARVRVILEATRIAFGKIEFGLIWTLRQVKVVQCLVPEEVGETVSILAKDDIDDLNETIA